MKAVVEQLAKDLADSTRTHVARTVNPALDRIAALEQAVRALTVRLDSVKDGKNGANGKDADMEALAKHLDARVAHAAGDLTARMVVLERRMETVKDGKDGKDGTHGKDADVEALTKHLDSLVAEAVASIPRPVPEPAMPGPKGDRGEPGEKGLDGAIGPAGSKGPQGERGETGQTGAKGEQGIQGPEGPAGRDGRDGLPGVPGLQGEKGLDGKDGRDGVNGKDGSDGLGFDDLEEVVEDGGRIHVRRYRSGDRVKEFRHKTAIQLYRGLWEQGRTYDTGDTVTWGGSMFCAKQETTQKPEVDTAAGREHWTLCVARGREGKPGKQGDPGPQGSRGEKGEPGRGHY